jgi:very-short-patch-repair endonuclease
MKMGLHDVMTRADLFGAGMSRRTLAAALSTGQLVRARRDRYVRGDAPRAVVESVRIGGRVACLSLLQVLGVFVFENAVAHVHITRGMSRMRSAEDRARSLEPRRTRVERLHWRPLVRPDGGTAACVSVVDAVIQAVLCQTPRHAIATIDSALNKRLIATTDLADVFSKLPARFAVLRGLVDGRAQSGPETLVRLMARSLGCSIALQVKFDGVGYVDLVLDDWLVVECDSREFHHDWAQQVKDRERDLALAARGYATLRLTAAQILYRPTEVQEALRRLLATHAGCRVE